MTRVLLLTCILTSLLSLKTAAQAGFRKLNDNLPAMRPITVLPQNFYNQYKGYICKREDQLQKATGLNLFIRLGSKNYVDFLERRPNAIRP
jgi:hypothetical protein